MEDPFLVMVSFTWFSSVYRVFLIVNNVERAKYVNGPTVSQTGICLETQIFLLGS